GRYVSLEILDDGPGLTAEAKSRMFEPFFTTKFTGRGLGLSSVLRIVRRHGGAIAVDSEPGRGTALRVLVPSAPAPAEPVVPAPEVADGNGLILVVDDDASVRRVARRLLERRGYAVAEAASGPEM